MDNTKLGILCSSGKNIYYAKEVSHGIVWRWTTNDGLVHPFDYKKQDELGAVKHNCQISLSNGDDIKVDGAKVKLIRPTFRAVILRCYEVER